MATEERAAKIPFMTVYNRHSLTISAPGIESIFFDALFAGISIPFTIASLSCIFLSLFISG